MPTILQVAAVAALASLLLTPLVRRLMLRLNIVDHPDTHRKLHAQPTPLGGGIVIICGSMAALIAVVTFSPWWRAKLLEDVPFLLGLSGAVVTICVVGLLDDRFGLRGRQKLLGQFVAAAILLASGLVIERIAIFHWNIGLGALAIPFTLFWLLGAINALNLIDGMDGLATSVGLVISAAIAILCVMTDHHVDGIIVGAVAGSLLGFLIYNSPPASIFLGDSGSMLIGLVLGALAIRSALKGPATVALAAPVAIWAIPIMDTSMAILRRKLTGRSIYATDRSHLHHSLLRRGYSGSKAVIVVGLLCACTGIAAIVSIHMGNELLAYGAIVVVVSTLVLSKFFGHQEFLLLSRRLKQIGMTMVPYLATRRSRQLHARLQGTRQWEDLWETLTEFADRFDLSKVQLNVSLPAIQEEYHASWERKEHPADAEVWHSDIPLVARNVTVGRLRITGACANGSVCTWMGDLIAGLKPFETHMLELIKDSLGYPGGDGLAEPGDDILPDDAAESTDENAAKSE